MTRSIVPCGGQLLEHPPLVRYVLSLARSPRPKVLFDGTASGDDPGYRLMFYEALAGHDAVPAHLALFDRTVEDVEEYVRDHDVVIVGGGNTANLLAVWRVHGVDRAHRAAYDEGVVLAGWSAGALCWFEGGVTDSFTPQLGALRDGLGLLPGSVCPHYDSQERRRPVYAQEIAAGLPPGIALEDGVAARYEDGRLAEVVTAREGGRAYAVDTAGERALAVRAL